MTQRSSSVHSGGPSRRLGRADRTRGIGDALWLTCILTWPHFANDIYLVNQPNSAAVFWLLDVIVYALIPVATLVVLGRRGLISLGSLGWSGRVLSNAVWGALLCGYLIVMVHWLAAPMLASVLGTGEAIRHPIPDVPLWWRWAVIVYVAIAAGVLEEVIYRGAITTWLLETRLPTWLVIVLSSFLFGAIHWGQGSASVMSAFVWACVPTFLYVTTRRLVPLVVCHVLYDFLVFSGLA